MKKIKRNLITIGSASLMVLPIVSVVSCNKSDYYDIELTTDSMSYAEGNREKVVTGILNPKNIGTGNEKFPTITKFVGDDYQTNTSYKEISAKHELILSDNGTPNEIQSKESFEAQFLNLNKLLTTEIHDAYNIYRGTEANTPELYNKFLDMIRISYQIDKTTNTWSIQLFEYTDNSAMSRWIENVFFNPQIGIKFLDNDDLTYQYFAGGGLLTFRLLYEQYHLNGNYNNSSNIFPLPGDVYAAEEQKWLSAWNGKVMQYQKEDRHGNLVPATSPLNPEKTKYVAFASVPGGIHDITVKCKTMIDLNANTLSFVFTFTQGGVPIFSDPLMAQGNNVVGTYPGHEIIGIPIQKTVVVPNGMPSGTVTTPSTEIATLDKFERSLEALFRIYHQFKNDLPLIAKIQPEVAEPLDEMSRIESEIMTASILTYKTTNGILTADFNREFSDKLYESMCENSNIDIEVLINLIDSRLVLINDIGGFTSCSPDELLLILSAFSSILNSHTFIDNYPGVVHLNA